MRRRLRKLVIDLPGPRPLSWLATLVVWGITAALVAVVVFIAILLPFDIDCARSGDDPARRTVTRFQRAVGARDWEAGCALVTGRARSALIEEARATHELSPTCTAGLQLAARRERLPSGQIEKVSAPWLWDDATVTTARGRYRLTTPDQNCIYLINRLG